MRKPTYRYPPSNTQIPYNLQQVLAALAGGIALFIGLLAFVMIGFQVIYFGRVYPGVHMAGIDLGGKSRTQAMALLEENIKYPKTGKIALEFQGQLWLFTPEQLGVHLDAEECFETAYAVGRHGWPWARWADRIQSLRDGKHISPIFMMDEYTAQAILAEISTQINQPTREASLSITGLDVVVEPGQVGLVVDTDMNLLFLRLQLSSLQDGSLPLAINMYAPAILDASDQAAIAQKILSQPLTLTIPNADAKDPGPWTFDQNTLASMLVIERVVEDGSEKFKVGLDRDKLFNFLYPLAPGLAREPVNTRFMFNDETRQLEVIRPAIIGRELLVEESIKQINDALQRGEHSVNLAFQFTDPEVTDDKTAEELGITEVVSAQSTYFYGSDTGRVQNIKAAAAQFHGLLIPPGATFSMVDNIGEISLDTGYAEAWIIYGDRTIKGVGGGVCQVSTTLFRAVFFGGFPVVERHPHAYRVTYYELIYTGGTDAKLAGLDATVYAPVVDFKFTNDTPYWLLMETYVYESTRQLLWKFYSTSDGRTVEWETTGLQDIVKPPKPKYVENPDLKAGAIKKMDFPVDGADVTITRTVWRNGSVLFTDQFETHYEPWQIVCEYGPGTKDYPPPEKKQDPYSCQPKKKE